MKENYIHVCFVIDESGSMYSSVNDVIGGFKKVIDEQKAEQKGQCSVSLYKFNNSVTEIYRGRDINDVKPLVEGHCQFDFSNVTSWLDNSEEWDSDISYSPAGGTAMFDGIGTAIDNIGKWLNDMPESERPSKNLIVIMTDGGENASRVYTSQMVKDRIKEQETKYSWTFLYMGTDITTTQYADSIGIKSQIYTTRSDYSDNYDIINNATKCFRMSDSAVASIELDNILQSEITAANCKYSAKTGLDMTSSI